MPRHVGVFPTVLPFGVLSKSNDYCGTLNQWRRLTWKCRQSLLYTLIVIGQSRSGNLLGMFGNMALRILQQDLGPRYPDGKDHQIDVDLISIRKEGVGLMFNRCRSDGLCSLGMLLSHLETDCNVLFKIGKFAHGGYVNFSTNFTKGNCQINCVDSINLLSTVLYSAYS